MSWGDELEIIRRFLRDPSGNVWSEALLRHLWNDTQNDFQNRTGILEDVVAQRVPDLYHSSYMQDWEYGYGTGTDRYQCLRKHDDLVFCHAWEPQEYAEIASDTEEVGAHFTQPWEAFVGLIPGEEVRMRFPSNFHSVKFIAYDEEQIFPTTRKLVQSRDSSYLLTEGEPISYFIYDEDRQYVLYPRPSTAFVDDVEGDGIAFVVEDDSEDTDLGIIAIRTGSGESNNVGASVDVIGVQDNLLLVYDVSPTEMSSQADEPDFPGYLTRYIRSGVISRAYDANTDGRIPSLAKFWSLRYELGIRAVKKFMRNRRRDRDYRLMTQPVARRGRKRLPRLPDTYPAV